MYNSKMDFQGSARGNRNDLLDAGESQVVGSRSTPDSCRETLRINHEEQAFHHYLTLGIQEKLQKNRMIKNIKTVFRKPVDKSSIGMWERKNGVILPADLKEYYQSTNGFKLTWSLEHAGDTLPIGELSINPLNQLVELHAAAKQSLTSSTTTHRSTLPGGRPKTCSESNGRLSGTIGSKKLDGNDGGTYLQVPITELEQTIVGSSGQAKLPISGLYYNPSNKIFILDSGRSGWGKVCLVYPSPPSLEASGVGVVGGNPPKPSGSTSKPGASLMGEPYVEVWFMDPSFQWHYLAPTFTHFYRMLLFHLGLPQWQYRFTPFGLSSWAEQMFWLVAPHLLQPPKLSKFPSMYHGEGLWCTDVPSEAATPNPTQNILTNQLFRRKKKDREKQQQPQQ